MAPVAWSSKKQATIETSVFGSEFLALKHRMEYIRGLRYKLRMMGIPISGPAYVYGDNMSVIYNTSRPESTLKKKSNSVCYHAVRESVAMGEIITAHVRSEENPADLCTKTIPGGSKRRYLVSGVLYDIYDEISRSAGRGSCVLSKPRRATGFHQVSLHMCDKCNSPSVPSWSEVVNRGCSRFEEADSGIMWSNKSTNDTDVSIGK